MSHRPWESPGRGAPPSRPPPTPVSATSSYNYHPNTLPPISQPVERNSTPAITRKRRRREPDFMASYVAPAPPPPLPVSPPTHSHQHSHQHPHHQPHSPQDYSSALPSPSFPSSSACSPQSFSGLRQPQPPLYQHSLPPSPYQRSQYTNASSLSAVVAQVYNVVQDLTLELDPTLPGHPKPPRHTPVDPSEFTSLETIGQCLETVFMALHARVGTFHKYPTTTLSPSSSSMSSPHAASTSRLSDLQHQVSSLTLERETARKDNNHLQSQLSRSQRRAETLGGKITSLEIESEEFERERERLLGNIEMLEETLGEIRVERNDARKELRVSRKQWGMIIVNAGKIEGALVKETKELRRRLESVSNTIQITISEPTASAEQQLLHSSTPPPPPPPPLPPPQESRTERCCESPCPCGTPDSEQLKEINERLRQRIEVLEAALEKLRASSSELRGLTTRLVELGKDMENESISATRPQKTILEAEKPLGHCAG